MSAVLVFATPRFYGVDEPRNPINPGKGYALLTWLVARLTALGLVTNAEVEAKDRGWSVVVEVFGDIYLLECSRDVGEEDSVGAAGQGTTEDWVLGVAARRSVVERLLGRRELTADNALLRIVLEILEREPDFFDIELVLD